MQQPQSQLEDNLLHRLKTKPSTHLQAQKLTTAAKLTITRGSPTILQVKTFVFLYCTVGYSFYVTQLHSIMENGNQEQPKRNCHFQGIYSTESLLKHYLGQKTYINICTHTLKFSNGVLVRVPINNYIYEQQIAFFLILLAETPLP